MPANIIHNVNDMELSTKNSNLSALSLKANKLARLANSVLTDKKHAFQLARLIHKLGLNKNEVIQAYVDFDLDIYTNTNDMYNEATTRLMLHLHNLLKGSWHQERQRTIQQFIKLCKPKNLVDMGFGEPTAYVQQALCDRNMKITLCDFAESAFEFAKLVLAEYSESWDQIVSLKKLDMESGEYVGDYDAYIFQDSLEHIHNPTAFLKYYVEKTPDHSKFIISLPIGPIIPVHYIAWSSIEEASAWLEECGLHIQTQHCVYPNPKVDLFADFTDSFFNFYSICGKKPT